MGRKGWSSNSKYVRSKIAKHWTYLAVECYLQDKCYNCLYWRYCKQVCDNGTPIMRMVVEEIYENVGKPSEEIIDKVKSGDYN